LYQKGVKMEKLDLPEYTLPKNKVFKKNGKLKDKFYKKELLKLQIELVKLQTCLLYTSPSPRDRQKSRMPSSA
jgi:hypothetical protein